MSRLMADGTIPNVSVVPFQSPNAAWARPIRAPSLRSTTPECQRYCLATAPPTLAAEAGPHPVRRTWTLPVSLHRTPDRLHPKPGRCPRQRSHRHCRCRPPSANVGALRLWWWFPRRHHGNDRKGSGRQCPTAAQPGSLRHHVGTVEHNASRLPCGDRSGMADLCRRDDRQMGCLRRSEGWLCDSAREGFDADRQSVQPRQRKPSRIHPVGSRWWVPQDTAAYCVLVNEAS